jgi:hypothetical protein
MFRVTKKFTSGYLKGLTLTETTREWVRPGWFCRVPVGSTSPYVVVKVERIK